MIEEKTYIEISEGIWQYRIDCFSAILYMPEPGVEQTFVDIYAKSLVIESICCPTIKEAREALEESLNAWAECSGVCGNI